MRPQGGAWELGGRKTVRSRRRARMPGPSAPAPWESDAGGAWRFQARGSPVGGGGSPAAAGAGGGDAGARSPAASRATSSLPEQRRTQMGRRAGVPRGARATDCLLPAGADGRWLADVYLGRYRHVLSLLLYLAASGLLASTAFPDSAQLFSRRDACAAAWSPLAPSPGCQYTSRATYCAPPSTRRCCCSPWPPAPSGATSPLSRPARAVAEGRGVWGEGVIWESGGYDCQRDLPG